MNTRIEQGGVNISEAQHLTGQCPQCGWTPPLQNQYRPNHFAEYIDDKGRISVLSELKDVVEIQNGDGDVIKTVRRLRDDRGLIIKRDGQQYQSLTLKELEAQIAAEVSLIPVSQPLQTNPQKAVNAQLKVAPNVPVQSNSGSGGTGVLPSKPIPAGLVKTAEEIAATPKASITPAPVNLPTPVLSDVNAPVDMNPKKVTQ